MSAEKKADVDPSIAFCGIPLPSVEICMGALPAATFRTAKERDKKTLRFLSLRKNERVYRNHRAVTLLSHKKLQIQSFRSKNFLRHLINHKIVHLIDLQKTTITPFGLIFFI